MGNIQNREAIEKTNHILNEIMKYDCCLLEIGNRGGKTGYIDFITESMLEGHDVMKGVDIDGRSFIVVKAHVIYKDLFIANTFTTFFQIYRDENLWMGCSQKGRHFMETEGGMTIIQLELLRDLLYNGSVKIDNSNARCIYRNDSHRDDIIVIKLGHKNDSLFIKEETCINKPITAVDYRKVMNDLLYDVPEDTREYIMEEFDDQEQEIQDLKNDLEIANEKIARIEAEMATMKNKMNRMKVLQKPLFERRTNGCIPATYPNTRLWADTPEEDIEIERTFGSYHESS